MASPEITLEAVPSAGEIPAEAWDACANPGANRHHFNGATPNASCANSRPYYNPFVSHAFFSAAEKSGSAAVRTGWGPRHLIAKLDGAIAGIVPC
ncbi:MAG TPA: peptidogalycan biosysnthesis protein, partial [Bradyrhizobium sp.]|nr:peptidogalycan biosysnthesis protein [Bradyrhizobium sp.]